VRKRDGEEPKEMDVQAHTLAGGPFKAETE
jgi:hypothetical protein